MTSVKGKHIATPQIRNNRLPKGGCLAERLAPRVAIKGGKAPPILAPNISAKATETSKALVLESVIISSTVARLEWAAQAKMAANTTANIKSCPSAKKICWIITDPRIGIEAARMSFRARSIIPIPSIRRPASLLRPPLE